MRIKGYQFFMLCHCYSTEDKLEEVKIKGSKNSRELMRYCNGVNFHYKHTSILNDCCIRKLTNKLTKSKCDKKKKINAINHIILNSAYKILFFEY